MFGHTQKRINIYQCGCWLAGWTQEESRREREWDFRNHTQHNRRRDGRTKSSAEEPPSEGVVIIMDIIGGNNKIETRKKTNLNLAFTMEHERDYKFTTKIQEEFMGQKQKQQVHLNAVVEVHVGQCNLD